MSRALAERLTRTVAGDVLKDMVAECRGYARENLVRADRMLVPADQFDRLCAALELKQFSLPDIGILERRLGHAVDGGGPIKIELVPNDRLEAAKARGRQIIEPPKRSTKLILPKGYGRG